MLETPIIFFIISSLILIITPGQDMILVMSRSVSQGWRAGVATAAGISTGLMGHTILAALGLGAVLQASGILFSLMKIAGAIYLVYLGIRMFFSAASNFEISSIPNVSFRKMFFQGAFSNISNPKIAIFYFAYLPQFIPAGTENPTVLLFILGVSFSILTFLIKGPIGYTSGRLSGWLINSPSALKRIYRTSGFVLIFLGLRLFF